MPLKRSLVWIFLILMVFTGCSTSKKITPGFTTINEANENHFHKIENIEIFNNLILSNQDFIVVAGQTTCGACASYKVLLNQYILETSVKIYYIEINQVADALETIREYGKLEYTPTTYLFKNSNTGQSKMVTQFGNFSNYQDLVSTFQRYVILE